MGAELEALTAAGIDCAQGLERFLGNEGLYTSFLKKFLNDGSAAAFKEDLAAGDLEKAEKDVHTLKGTAGNLSLTRLFQAADATVKALRAGEDRSKIDALAAEVERVHKETCEAIRSIS